MNTLAKARDEGPLLLALRSYHDIDGPQGSGGDAPTARHASITPIRVRDDSINVHVYRGVKLSEEKLP